MSQDGAESGKSEGVVGEVEEAESSKDGDLSGRPQRE